MIRSTLILIVSSVALLLLYAGYNMIVLPTTPTGGNSAAGGAGIGVQQPVSEDSIYKVEAGGITAEVAPGQTISFTRYDEKTGRPIQTLSCEEWRKAPGSNRDFILKAPQLEMILPSGMVARVTADEGTIVADRVREKKVEPKSGTLRGRARIAIDRRPSEARTLGAPQADDMFTIETGELSFDLERGFLKSADRVQVLSDLFEMRGHGLELVWNQAANRVESLVVDRGEELVLFIDGGMLGGLGRMVDAPPAPESQPASAAASMPREKEPLREKRLNSYMCTLDGGIVADHYLWSGERDAGLEAEVLRLTFDIGGGAGRVLQGDRGRRGNRGLKDRLVVKWNGRFAVGPIETPAKLLAPRRQIEISGREVKLDLKDTCIVCGKLDYHDQSQRLWLTAAPNRPIELGLGDGLRADADGVFVDRKAQIVKLLGDVKLSTRSGQAKSAMNLACNLWAELRLLESSDEATAGDSSGGEEVTNVLSSSMRLQSALLVGDVRAGLDDQEVRAGRLEAFFREPRGKEPMEQLLSRIVAAGSVRFSAQRESRWPRWTDALSAKLNRPLSPARLSLAPQSLECDWVELGVASVAAPTTAPTVAAAKPLRPAAAQSALPAPRVQAQSLEARGDVRLRDALRRVEAYGQSLSAKFLEGNRISKAVVGGTPSDPARLHAATYDVRGGAIEIDPQAETLTVPGKSTLTLASDRGLRGERRAQPQLVIVDSRQRLKVDNKANQVEFLGEVEARSGSDSLKAASLVLHLQDVAQTKTTAKSSGGLFREITRRTGKAESAGAAGALGAGISRGSQRKEPVKIVARAALVESALYEPGDPIAMLYQSIDAPELEVDLPRRTVRTTGLTNLMMTDRRMDADPDAARDASGLPSALLTRGPSQTAMQCENSLLYVIGDESAARRDSIVLDGRVRLRHVAGKEMVRINEQFPLLASNPDMLDKLKSRNVALDADRIEGTLEGGSRRPQTGLTPGVRLAWLNARGNVYMMDKQGAGVREVHATQVEFDRPQQLVRVLGSTNPRIDARVTYVNAKTQQADIPWFGAECTIDLANNTIRTGASQGEFRRR